MPTTMNSDAMNAPRTPVPPSRLPKVGTTIFTVMSALATEHQAVNLGQGFPDFGCDPALIDAVSDAMREGLKTWHFMLGLSVLLGIAAVMLAARWMGQQAASDKTTVLVASRDMELGQAITPTMLESVPWPKGAVPNGAFDDPKKLEGRVVRISIFKGEPVLAPKLAPEGTKAGLDSVIKAGHRAITVKVIGEDGSVKIEQLVKLSELQPH